MSDAGLETLRTQVDVTRRHWRTGQLFFAFVVILIVGLAGGRGAWSVALVGGGLLAPFVVVLELMVRKCDWDRNPLLANLRDRPEEVEEIEHAVASSSTGSFAHSFFRVTDREGNHYAFRVRDHDKDQVTRALAERCRNATFSGPGFEPAA